MNKAKEQEEGFFFLCIGADSAHPDGLEFDHTFLFADLKDVEDTVYEYFSDLNTTLGYGMYALLQVITKEKIFPRENILPHIQLTLNLPSLKLVVRLPSINNVNQDEVARSNSFPLETWSRIDSAEEEWCSRDGGEVEEFSERMEKNSELSQALDFLPKDVSRIILDYCQPEAMLQVDFSPLHFPRSFHPPPPGHKIYLEHVDGDTCCEVVSYSPEKTEKCCYEYKLGENF